MAVLTSENSDTLVQPTVPPELSNEGLLVPATLIFCAPEMVIPLTNLSDQCLPVLRESILGFAAAVDCKWEDNDSHSEILPPRSKVHSVRVIKTIPDPKSRFPEHLHILWERNVEGLEDEDSYCGRAAFRVFRYLRQE